MASVLLTLLIGPLAAFFPRSWRRALPFAENVRWGLAALLSGLLEFAASIVALGHWYLFEMMRITDTIVSSQSSASHPMGITDHQVSGASLFYFALHPFTWLLAFFFFEGALRLCAAVATGSVLPAFPILLLERMLFLLRHRSELQPGQALRENAASFYEGIWERVHAARQPELPDQLRSTAVDSEEFLEISASRRKADWVPPKTVRVDDLYYRLEGFTVGKGTHPFHYSLRRLERGVPGRTVLLYNTGNATQFIRR